MMKSIIATAILVLALGFAIGYWAATIRYEMPNCPLEDSCYADYQDGTWHIIPVEQEILPND